MTTPTAKRIAVLGAGKMGGILLQGFLANGVAPGTVCATVTRPERAATLSKEWGITVTTDNLAAATGADVVLLGVKPHQIATLAQQIAPVLAPNALLISVAAGVETKTIEQATGKDIAVIRSMPNTPAKVGAGMTALCRGRFVTDDQLALAQHLLNSVGRTVVVEEKHMNAVTGISGSGPAFIYIILEALAEAGVNIGLPRDTATLLAAQTMFGSTKMVLESGQHPAQLKDQVTTPGGCTVAGIYELEQGGLRSTLIKTVKRTAERAKELAGN